MIPMLLFSAVAAALVYLAGRGDAARDPRLTLLALALLAVFPLLGWLPKLEILPAAGTSEPASRFPWALAGCAVWLAGFAVGSVRLGLSLREISKWRNRSVALDCIDGVEIRRLAGLKGPVAAGVRRPVIFVPDQWQSLPETTRRIVLDHELAHHRRRDPLWRWIAEIACAVNGCNPLVIWMVRRLTMQCEYACDAEVLKKGTPVKHYARVLCDFADDTPSRGPVLAMAATSSLESRVRRMLEPRRKTGSIGLIGLIALTLLCAGLLASLGARRGSPAPPVPPSEVDLRWSANPFPGED